jgi:[ribosomal protein S5]-alanine N-acetyltransferase
VIQTSVQTISQVGVAVAADNWQHTLPVLTNDAVTLRELRLSDAPTLLEMLNTDEVSRFVTPPMTTVAGFERFIAWAHRDRAAGKFVCFGIVPAGCDQAVGIIQVRAMTPGFETAEWGFAIGSSFWGSGVFLAAAREVLAFTFKTLGAERLEGRSACENVRANRALEKLGATQEAVLRQSFLRDGVYHDQMVWTIRAEEWRQS